MSTADIKTSEWLEDIEIRAEYGSATFKYDIASVLVAARKMRNLTQAALAKIAGVSQAYIAKLESGEANPTIGRIGAILASIWLKAEINLVPLVSSFQDEIAEAAEAIVETNPSVATENLTEINQWLQLQIQSVEQRAIASSPLLNVTQSAAMGTAGSRAIGTSGSVAVVIQPPVISPERGIGPVNVGQLTRLSS
jgi:transcriptional regulator with XRE-family HTH domain